MTTARSDPGARLGTIALEVTMRRMVPVGRMRRERRLGNRPSRQMGPDVKTGPHFCEDQPGPETSEGPFETQDTRVGIVAR